MILMFAIAILQYVSIELVYLHWVIVFGFKN